MMHVLRWSAFLLFWLIVSSGCGSGGNTKSSGPEAAFTYVGAWVNPAYADGKGPPVKIVFTADTLAFYKNDTDTAPWADGSLDVADDWTADGGHYFKCSATSSQGNGYFLIRVRANNNTMEANISTTGYPAAISGGTDQYGIWTRQQ